MGRLAPIIAVALGVLLGVMDAVRPAAAAPSAEVESGMSDFDFLRGEWNVHHRYLKQTPGGLVWTEADGPCRNAALEGGWANIDEYVMSSSSGPYRAATIRSYDPKTGQWAIWWLDGRAPTALDPPMLGSFKDGIGTFYGTGDLGDKSMRIRFIWSRITPNSAQWEQAYSFDEGKTWETNWSMAFTRAPAR